MKPIKLTTEETGTIHVDDVDVSKGVYYTYWNGKGYVHLSEGIYYARGLQASPDFKQTLCFTTFKALFLNETKEYGAEFFTLSGQRITLEKQLTINDLKDSDHVGFVDKSGNKGFVAYCSSGHFAALDLGSDQTRNCNGFFYSGGKNVQECLLNISSCIPDHRLAELYLFDKRTGGEDSLFGWLNS